jgi:hypothetical protein
MTVGSVGDRERRAKTPRLRDEAFQCTGLDADGRRQMVPADDGGEVGFALRYF